jgi:hypothetical protein
LFVSAREIQTEAEPERGRPSAGAARNASKDPNPKIPIEVPRRVAADAGAIPVKKEVHKEREVR